MNELNEKIKELQKEIKTIRNFTFEYKGAKIEGMCMEPIKKAFLIGKIEGLKFSRKEVLKMINQIQTEGLYLKEPETCIEELRKQIKGKWVNKTYYVKTVDIQEEIIELKIVSVLLMIG